MTGARRAGVLGHPISHSLSPLLHRAAYRELGLPWTYDAYDVAEEGLGEFIAGLDETWGGLSLTMPLKVSAIRYADTVDPVARALGVINTVVVRPEGDGLRLHGANTDIHGVRQALVEAGVETVTSALLLGSGATATSAMAALMDMGCDSPVVVAKSWDEAEGLLRAASEIGASPTIIATAEAVEAMGGASIVVSTVPAEVGAIIGESLTSVQSGAVLLDAVYDPLVTPLALAWGRVGGHAINGSRMLLHQAAEQVRLMTGLSAPIEVMNDALVSHLSP